MLSYLKLAAASIADQEITKSGQVEHIVIDGGSSDDTPQWLDANPSLKSICEKDEGMYDAINKGLKIASGDILAYLNCDEQYLPGTLDFVRDYFSRHPEVDIIFGDALLTRPDGSLVAYRKGYRPRWRYILSSHLYVLSCTMFFRRKIIQEGNFFDTRYRAVGDADFVVRLLRKGYETRHIKRYFSVFTMTGDNLSTDQRAIKEQKELLTQAPFAVRKSRWILNALRLTVKLFSGAYFQSMPLKYQVYTINTPTKRTQQTVHKASPKWRFQ